MRTESGHLARRLRSMYRSIVIVVALATAGAMTAVAWAQDPPPPPPEGPAISQYVETVPSGDGGNAVGVGKPRSKPLPKKAAKKLDAKKTPLAPKLRSIATSSSYGAPQQTLPRRVKQAPVKKQTPVRHRPTAAKPRKVPNTSAAHPVGRDDGTSQAERTALSAAVSAATGGSDRAPVILLAAIVLATTAAALAAAARRGRQGR
jgi:hypothetical protein